jgi:hypothetical protein
MGGPLLRKRMIKPIAEEKAQSRAEEIFPYLHPPQAEFGGWKANQ